MARIRTVKPEFWTSEQVISCSHPARLLFIGMWNFCDDRGVHTASYVRLKAEIFPGDDISIEEIKKLVSELLKMGLLREYAVNDQAYWIVTGWKHQKIEKPTYKFPPPESGLINIKDCSVNNQLALNDNSVNIRRLVDESSPPEGNGREGNGKENNISGVSNETPSCVVGENRLVAGNDIQLVFFYWQSKLNHPRAVLDLKRKSRIAQALKLGYSINDLKQAIDGCAITPYNMGENDRNQKYDDIELICRDASRIDRFIENANNPPLSVKNLKIKNNLMSGVI